MADYWAKRAAATQEKLTTKSIADTERQLIKYYSSSQEKIIGQFEKTYNKVFSRLSEGKEPTPADLYKLDTYWKMQAQLKEELQQLGYKQAEILDKKFTEQYINIYNSLAKTDGELFNSIDTKMANEMINKIWCADGKSWSERIWTNTDKLQQALNDNLIDCLVTGKKTTELKQLLQQEFKASYSRADALVRTELAHIQTQAAVQRYNDYGIKLVEILADKDERRCEICGKLHAKRFPINAKIPIPAHTRCRCCIVPVVED